MFRIIFQNQWKGCQILRSRNSSPDPADPGYPADLPEVVAASAPQTLPSTRAGGQDDVSSNKLPQIIFFNFRTLAAIFEFYMASQDPPSHLKTFLEPVASFSQSMGPLSS